MSERRERVSLHLSDTFTGRLVAAAEAGRQINATLALSQATWEPHDWDDFA